MAEAENIGDAKRAEELAGKYLTFKLGSEEYGLEILKVQEIIKMMEVTHIPKTPEFVKGVINLRGKVIPVVDLRLKFGMEEKELTENTCIIVAQIRGSDEDTVVVGTIVDEVSEVMDIKSEEIESAPEFGSSIETAFILGMAKAKGRVKILLDIDKVLSMSEISALESVA